MNEEEHSRLEAFRQFREETEIHRLPMPGPRQNLARAGSNRNWRKKAFKGDLRRFLSSRCCLNPSWWAILDKVLLPSLLRAPFFSRLLSVSLEPTRMVHSQVP